MKKESVLTLIFATLVLFTRAAVFIFTPLYLDALTPWNVTHEFINTTARNATRWGPVDNTTMPIYQQVDFFFAITFR